MERSQQQEQQVSQCEVCFVKEKCHLLHNIRHEGIYRRVCSLCVLRLNRGSFCSICFQVFGDVSSIPVEKVDCSKCTSIAHLDCFRQNHIDSYMCSLCSIPNFSFFNDGGRMIDLKLAKLLATAAFFAFISISKAAVSARKEAECRFVDAVIAKKKAMQALEHFAIVSEQAEEENKTETEDEDEIIEVSMAAATPPPQPQKNKMSKNNGVGAEEKGKAVLGDVGSIKKKKKKRSIPGCSSVVVVAKSNSEKHVSVEKWDGLKKYKGSNVNGSTSKNSTNSQSHIIQEDQGNKGLLSALSGTGHLHRTSRNT